jgi:uncharacterized membrane protein
VNRVRSFAAQIYDFIAGDPVILGGVVVAFAAVAALGALGIAEVVRGILLVVLVVATLVLSLLREHLPQRRR